ncbi:MAG: flagellar basal body P-ring formation protein FlgA [Nitrospira sp.]|nr:flagellar basal body P-ring formation protein FlgA [Nitrospira sp.]MBH0183613.1 flagellar basal body P-ring formation protein FlgA [Nitrospira sp.]MBH0186910.1 flagellar basal body P-ring formation protein FlgA [Nitrospira sp.]MBH0188497.1 flagellar basal body P-ring formation protein FlgA [Nitrospira sp.]MBH0194126.1 flagellar basal body P-ring formation protein FlgA [Nitrospira sp.]
MSRFHLVSVLFLLSATLGSVTSAEAGRSEAMPVSLAAPGHRSHEGGATRPAEREISGDLLTKTIRGYLEAEWGRKVKDVQVTVLDPSEPIKVPSGDMELHVIPVSNDERLGRRMFQMAVNVNGKSWNTVEVLADVAAMIDALAPNRSLKSDEIIDGQDLKTVRMRTHQLSHPFMTDREEVIGKSAARPLPADVPFRTGFLKAPVLVKKGDRVMIEAKRGGLSIQAYGVTKSSGRVGQTIMVSNQDSGRELQAKIVGPGLVQVEF